MRLLKRYLVSETARCLENGVRLSVIGRRDRLSADLVRTIENTEQLTSGGDGLQLRLAIDYSARESITRAAALMRGPECSQARVRALLGGRRELRCPRARRPPDSHRRRTAA